MKSKIFLILFFGIFSLAAIPVRQAGSEKLSRYLDAGVFIGGHEQGPINLLNVRYNISAWLSAGSGAGHNAGDKVERLVFDVGGDKPEQSSGRPGFFHITVQKSPRRVVVDLEDIAQTRVTAEQLTKLIEKSPHLSKVKFYYDSRFKNLTIEMPLKVAAKIEVFELASVGKPGRIVLDLKGGP